MIAQPKASEYPEYYEAYIKLIRGEDVLNVLSDGIIIMKTLLSAITEEKENYAYASGKWTTKEVFGHIIDTERIMAYRALRFARGDRQELPGFDENSYVEYADFSKRKLIDMENEFSSMRQSNISLFESFDEIVLERKGTANENSISVRALIYLIAGHHLHHMNILKQKYLL